MSSKVLLSNLFIFLFKKQSASEKTTSAMLAIEYLSSEGQTSGCTLFECFLVTFFQCCIAIDIDVIDASRCRANMEQHGAQPTCSADSGNCCLSLVLGREFRLIPDLAATVWPDPDSSSSKLVCSTFVEPLSSQFVHQESGWIQIMPDSTIPGQIQIVCRESSHT